MSINEHKVTVLGLSFLEFSGSKPKLLTDLFEQMGLIKGGENKSKGIELYHQNDIRFISNPSTGGNAEAFRAIHTRGACAMGFKVDDGIKAYELAIELGAEPAELTDYPIQL